MNRLAFTPQRWHSSPARQVSSARTISAPSSTSRARGERSPGLPSGVATTHNFGDVKDMAVIIQFEGCARVTDADKIESAGNIPFPACGQVGSGGFDHAAAFGGRHARLGRSKRLPLPRRRTSTKTSSSPSRQTRSSSHEPLRQLRASIRIPAFSSQSAAASSPARPFPAARSQKASPAAPSAVRAKRPGTSSGAWGTAQARAGRQNALWNRSPCAWQNHSRDSGGRAYP